MGEVWIQKNDRVTQTHPHFVLMSTVQVGRRVMAYVRKGIEVEVEVVEEEDNHIILQEKNKKRIGGVYVNGRYHRERWKEWLRKLEEEMGREDSILGDWNANLHS